MVIFPLYMIIVLDIRGGGGRSKKSKNNVQRETSHVNSIDTHIFRLEIFYWTMIMFCITSTY